MTVGDMIETAMVGRDGVVNGTSCTGALFQVAGAAFTIVPETLRSLADDFGPLRSILIRHEQVLLAQAQQSAGCNASHTVEARMCRWLLRIRDLTGSDEMQLTQEFLVQMLGVRRTQYRWSPVRAEGRLHQIQPCRIRLLDVAQIEAGACECYQTVKGHYDRLLAP
jgi:hypothetical protein